MACKTLLNKGYHLDLFSGCAPEAEGFWRMFSVPKIERRHEGVPEQDKIRISGNSALRIGTQKPKKDSA